MKKVLFIIFFIFYFISYAQNDTIKDYFTDGKVKTEIISKKGEKLEVKFYYKNGNVKYIENYQNNIVEDYFKNGQLRYRKKRNADIVTEELYDKNGELLLTAANGIILFNANNSLNYLKNKDLQEVKSHEHSHEHGHEHGHGHHH